MKIQPKDRSLSIFPPYVRQINSYQPCARGARMLDQITGSGLSLLTYPVDISPRVAVKAVCDFRGWYIYIILFNYNSIIGNWHST
jgi:hypothetical protein